MAKLPYHKKTDALINRMCRYVEREDFTLQKAKAKELILKTYDLFDLKRPKKVVWLDSPYNQKFIDSARSAGSAGSARSAGSAGPAWSALSAWSAGSARSALSAWSAGSAWSARSAGSAGPAESAGSAWSARYAGWTALDEEFYYFVFEYEYCLNPDKGKEPNENDRKYLKYSYLLLEALEAGLGYRVELNDVLYLAPTPVVRIDDQNRFHSEKEPAIRWKGAVEYYFLHGVRVNKNVALGKITKSMFLKEENAEVRRVMIERLGVDSILKLGAKKIDEFKKSERKDHNYGLYSLPLASTDPDKEAKYLSMRDTSTPRVYYIPVAPELTKAKEALLWYLNLEDYQFDKES